MPVSATQKEVERVFNAIELAANGAAFLDKWSPTWAQHVDLDVLDMGDPSHCVLAQLPNGDYTSHLYAMRGTADAYEFAVEHGFDANDDEGDLDRYVMFEELDEAWAHEVRARVPLTV